MALLAGGVNLPPDLAQTLSTIGNKAYGQIGANYKQAGQQQANDASVRGLPPPDSTSYGTERLGTTQGLDVGNLDATLGSGLGNTAYNNTLQERDFNQQKYLTDLIGNAAAPTTLEEVLSGIGGGAKAGLNLLPFLPSTGKSVSPGGSGVASSSGAGASGYDPNYGYYYD